MIHNVEQGTEEWHQLRKLRLTASHGQEISANGKGLETYVKNKILESFIEVERYTGKDMERGNQLEPIARQKYEFEHNLTVQEVGFISAGKYIGYSPDGLVNDDGLIEIKARNDRIHLDLLMTEKIDTKTIWQMQMGMLITNRKWCDFISYNKNFRKHSMFQKRVYPDPKAFNKLRTGIASGTKMLKELLSNKIIQAEINHVNNGLNI